MKYNSIRVIICLTIFLSVFVIMFVGYIYLSFSFWDVHNENWGNINNHVSQEIIEENFARQSKILEQESFLLWKIMTPYCIIGVPLVFLSGISLRKEIK